MPIMVEPTHKGTWGDMNATGPPFTVYHWLPLEPWYAVSTHDTLEEATEAAEWYKAVWGYE